MTTETTRLGAAEPVTPSFARRIAMRMRYGALFYRVQITRSRGSADVVVPVVMELLNPSSVVDFGCGVACWLAAFKAAGVSDITGIDGPWVERAPIQIPRESFVISDVGTPLQIGRRFDLAMSLEVGEHLKASQANQLVESLTSLSDRVLFSAATPHQGGAGHVNEQWPSWWIERFAAHGFIPVDCIRPRIWHQKKVAVWYRQNMLVFATADAIQADPVLSVEHDRTNDHMLDIVHPELFQSIALKRVSAVLRSYVQAAKVLRNERRVSRRRSGTK